MLKYSNVGFISPILIYDINTIGAHNMIPAIIGANITSLNIFVKYSYTNTVIIVIYPHYCYYT